MIEYLSLLKDIKLSVDSEYAKLRKSFVFLLLELSVVGLEICHLSIVMVAKCLNRHHDHNCLKLQIIVDCCGLNFISYMSTCKVIVQFL